MIITPPAIPDGSNFSRAPFPAARPQNDVTPPNGEAFDQEMPPNTPSTNPEPEAPPPPVVAVLQPKTEPGLMPTGRATTGVSVALDAARVEPMIRASSFDSRDAVLDNVRARMRDSDNALREMRRTESQMSAEGRTQFDSATDDVKAKEKALRKSIRTAEHASAENWESARAQLAADYDAYAASLSRIDTLAGIAPSQR